jgi:Uma2 family endonuclease
VNERATIIRQPATYQDVLDAPETMVAELIDGVLHLQPRPALPHAHASTSLIAEVGGPFGRGRGGPGGWIILFEPELHFGGDVLVPDLAGWRRERMAVVPNRPWSDLAPDWVCEVLSPSTRRIDVGAKREIYRSVGVRSLWFVDPLAGTLEAFEARDDAWMLLGTFTGDGEQRIPPFDAVPIDLGGLWAEEDGEASEV